MLYADVVAFHTGKIGSVPADLQDCAGYEERWGAGTTRFAVADGATSAYNSQLWAGLLVSGFVDTDHPGALADPHDPEAFRNFVAHAQKAWAEQPPPEDIFAAERFRREGSYSTFVGCLVYGLDGAAPCWRAVTVGDSVLFHVRRGQVLQMLPPLSAAQFTSQTEMLSTLPGQLDDEVAAALRGEGFLEPGDLLFAATDALSHWIVAAAGPLVWDALASIDQSQFVELVRSARRAGEMHDDDTSLVRAVFTTRPPQPELTQRRSR
jgi:hypothetical protein